MTGKLVEAMKRVESLSERDQNFIAARIMATLDGEDFCLTFDQYRAMAEAEEEQEKRRSEAQGLEELK